MTSDPSDLAPRAEGHARRNRSVVDHARRLGLVGGLGVCLVGLASGGWLVLRDGNAGDLNRAWQFTGPIRQTERCAAQEALDVQAKLSRHFDGRLSEEQASAMAPVVGLSSDELQRLVAADLYLSDVDCEASVSGFQQSVVGIVLAAASAAALAGAGVTAVAGRSRRS